MNLEEKKIESKLLQKTNIFDLYKDTVSLPDGKETTRFWIKHNPSVAIVPVTKKNEIILIKQYRHSTKQVLLEIPAGNLNNDELSPEECAQRELAEEIGYKAKSMKKIFEGYLLPGYCDEYMYFYLATELYPEKLKADDDENIEILTTPFNEALEMVSSGKIKDTKTAFGILYTKELI